MPTDPDEEYRALSNPGQANDRAGRATGGDSGVADAALFYVTRWPPQVGIELPPNLAGHLDQMKYRPAVGRVMAI